MLYEGGEVMLNEHNISTVVVLTLMVAGLVIIGTLLAR